VIGLFIYQNLMTTSNPTLALAIQVEQVIQVENSLVLEERNPLGNIRVQFALNLSATTKRDFFCDRCSKWHYIKCINMSNTTYVSSSDDE